MKGGDGVDWKKIHLANEIIKLAENYNNEFDLLANSGEFGEAAYDTICGKMGEIDFKGLVEDQEPLA